MCLNQTPQFFCECSYHPAMRTFHHLLAEAECPGFYPDHSIGKDHSRSGFQTLFCILHNKRVYLDTNEPPHRAGRSGSKQYPLRSLFVIACVVEKSQVLITWPFLLITLLIFLNRVCPDWAINMIHYIFSHTST